MLRIMTSVKYQGAMPLASREPFLLQPTAWPALYRLLGTILSFCTVSSAFSAEGDLPGEAGIELEPVMVTAERRYQSPERMPLSISAFSGAEIDNAQATSLEELQTLVPGLVITSAITGHGQPFIRGIGTDINGVGVENAVAVYIDGVYQSRAVGETMQFIDVERVEVLKGPQGVLYGRNATGGAINIITRAPSREPEGQVDVQAGSVDQRMVRGTVSGALSEGAVYGRLSLLTNRDDGDTHNALLGSQANENNVRGARGVLEFTPEGNFGLTLRAGYYRNDFSPTVKAVYPDVNPMFTVFHAQAIDDPHTVRHNEDGDASLTQAAVSATAQWDFKAKRLTSVTAFTKTDYDVRRSDLDGTEIPFVKVGSSGVTALSRFFSQDFTLVSDDKGPLTWTALASYQHERSSSPNWDLALPLLGLSTNWQSVVETDAFALGGQATYALGERWHVTAGARFSSENKNLESLRGYTNGILTSSMSDEKRWSAWTPKFVVDYSLSANSMLYASATKGFKSGGYNTIMLQPGFDPETAVSYEAGFKGRWLGGRLRASLAAFDTRYENMQVGVMLNNGGLLQTVIENAGKATSRGIEANIAASPTARLELSANIQLLKARFDEFLTLDPHAPGLGLQNQAGNPLPRAPNVTATLAAQYAWPVLDGGAQMRVRIEDAYRSKIYFTSFKDDLAGSPGLSIWNAMLSWESLKQAGWYGSAFVKNLTDRTYVSNIFDPQGVGYLAHFERGRTFGIQVGYRY